MGAGDWTIKMHVTAARNHLIVAYLLPDINRPKACGGSGVVVPHIPSFFSGGAVPISRPSRDTSLNELLVLLTDTQVFICAGALAGEKIAHRPNNHHPIG